MSGGGSEPFVDEAFPDAGPEYRVAAVSMGNPHLVLVGAQDLSLLDLPRVGPPLEHHPDFPQGTNVEFIRVEDGIVHARVWERGSGETMACGTGGCASLVAANLLGLAGRTGTVRFPGGDLEIDWAEDDRVYLTGPATFVFDGDLSDEWIASLSEAAAR
jgi:diaminopimelate epimerase